MNPKKSLKVVDLFAGCGGLALGLEYAGFFPIFVNELNDDARSTYIENRKVINPLLADPRFHESDVKAMVLDPRYLRSLERRLRSEFDVHHGEIDLLTGGPPCQGFSGIGHRRSYAVDKEQLPSNHLFQDMAALIHRLQPRAFLFENVRGLLTAKWNNGGTNGDVWKQVLKTFRSLPGYDVAFRLVRAKDYGVPQNRPRVLMVGFRNDVRSPLIKHIDSEDGVARGFLPAPLGQESPHLISLLGDLVDENYQNGGTTILYPRPARTHIQKQLRTARDGTTSFGKGCAVTEHDYSRHRPHVIEKFSAMIASGGTTPDAYKTKKFAQRVLRERWGPDGPSITATSLPDDYVHFSQPRILTVREWARLQMFPDWYEFSGKRSTGGIFRAGNPQLGVFHREVPKYTQIGNAVPVGLSQAIGEHLAKILR